MHPVLARPNQGNRGFTYSVARGKCSPCGLRRTNNINRFRCNGRSGADMTAPRDTIACVVQIIAQLKVIRIATRRVVACMSEQFPRWYGSFLKHPHQMMDEPYPTVMRNKYFSVALRNFRARPDMTGTLNDGLIRESSGQRRSVTRPASFCGKSFRRERFRSETCSPAAILDQTTG